jgi:hypothetical protein
MRFAAAFIVVTSMAISIDASGNLRAAAFKEHHDEQWTKGTRAEQKHRKLVGLQDRNLGNGDVKTQLKRKGAQPSSSYFGINIVGGEESDIGEFPYFGTWLPQQTEGIVFTLKSIAHPSILSAT